MGQFCCFWKKILVCGPYSTNAGRIETSEHVMVATKKLKSGYLDFFLGKDIIDFENRCVDHRFEIGFGYIHPNINREAD